ncbi:MAG: hypothetical protein IPN83_06415 [Holophagales bacterium]|nr:hypothetical protein [Holophagales bacterium]
MTSSAPLIHVQFAPSHLHRSLKLPYPLLKVSPVPPKSQRFPAESVHDTEPTRHPGTFPGAGTPFVPYVPD